MIEETVAKNYWPDAIVLGTVSRVISEGAEAILTCFTPLKGSGNKNTIDERRTIVAFYTFTRMVKSVVRGGIALPAISCPQARRLVAKIALA